MVVAGGQSPTFTCVMGRACSLRETQQWRIPGQRQNGDGICDVEEEYADNASRSMNIPSRDKHVMPWRVGDELKKTGANYIQAGLWRGFALREGNLIPGQQNFSG